MTMLTASLSKLSPKMTEYSFESTLYCLNMARIVTGSVADRVAPNVRHSSRESSKDSMPRIDHMYTNTLSHAVSSEPASRNISRTYPMPTAEIKVPRNANVRIEPKLRKKLSYG
jgi:hypothetical protein